MRMEGERRLTLPLTDKEAAWRSGWLEGEGSFESKSRVVRGRVYQSWEIRGASTDKDVIDYVQHIVGAGSRSIARNSAKNHKHKDAYRWSLSRRGQVEKLLEVLLPYFHSRRRTRALQMLKEMSSYPSRGMPQRRRQLCFKEVTDIRQLYSLGNIKQVELSKRFGVSQPHISYVVRGLARKDA
jgi:hypothetical protein